MLTDRKPWATYELTSLRVMRKGDPRSALAIKGDHNATAVWRRISAAVVQLANTIPPDPRADRTVPETIGRPPSPPGINLASDNVLSHQQDRSAAVSTL